MVGEKCTITLLVSSPILPLMAGITDTRDKGCQEIESKNKQTNKRTK